MRYHVLTLLFGICLSLVNFAVHAESGKVNINTADHATLDAELQLIGPKKAQAIIDSRTEHGPFNSPEELARVSGIGAKIVELNRDKIIVAEPQPDIAAIDVAAIDVVATDDALETEEADDDKDDDDKDDDSESDDSESEETSAPSDD